MYLDFLKTSMQLLGSKVAIVHDGKCYSYSWLCEQLDLTHRELESSGVRSNTVVSLRADFGPHSIPLLLALVDLGCIVVPLSTAVRAPEIMEEIANVQTTILADSGEIGIVDHNRTVTHALISSLINQRRPGLVLFSSGTTGAPKGALHDLVPLLNRYMRGGKALRSVSFLLFDHIGGFNTLLHTLSSGGELVTLGERTPDEVCRLIETYGVELLPTSPSFLNMLLFSRCYERYDLSSLKMITYGTEPMPQTTLNAIAQLFPHTQMKQTYGLSELGIMGTKSENNDSLWLKLGGEDFETKIVDEILFVRSKTAMLGYLNAPSPFDSDGWFNTNDRVEVKGEFVRILGRVTDLINVGGQKVYPVEVESVLLEFPGVKDAVASGMSHPMMGSVVVARVAMEAVSNPRAISLEIRKYCAARLEKFKIPVRIEIEEGTFSSSRFKRVR